MTEIVHVKDLEQFKTLVGSSKPTIVKAEGVYNACKMIAPIVKKLADATPQVQFISFDVDEASDIAEALSIRSMPTFFLYKSGEKIDQFSGATPPQVQAFVKKAAELVQ
ncbi:hypothetical protein E3Q23_03773 [Wallemia mellicola]|uniref:Thioredoxin domain-containing protein n=1 Tax=Wallemia mellicola TaxID=1708541 RepID=A0A4T0MTG1_9BASI|nr:hypothetical protein E3Q23_03773 [Wallemia mellicola]TIB72369.1 hypothetical protein E3Q24_01754 [Wallemia mellicola]TIB82014.1 hypothetical protein E3Q21_03553 [Wallemia mellicola]TIB84418.1 hypothetical protein E3Q20_03697 [Wallemia mellicola]TIB87075.1 hypothetical protein E3Q19_03723 [Wallemia mellicola]